MARNVAIIVGLAILIGVKTLPVAGQEHSLGPVWRPRVHAGHSPHPIQKIDWSRQTMYFILIDRFCNGDPRNDDGGHPGSHVLYQPELGNNKALRTYQGGDLQGVIDKLDYLRDLGITAIWLSPIFDNSDTDFVGWWPYHGYSPVDFFNVDEHFGDIALLKKLVQKSHQHGIKVLLDMIFNHVAPDHPWVRAPQLWENQGYRYWFHPHSGQDASTSIQDWQNQDQLETRELNGLPDLAQENPHVYDFLLDVAKFWIVETGCDGYRLDAVKHVPREFWSRICHDLHDFAGENFLLLGEVFSGDAGYVASYQDLGFNALFDIPLYYTINRVFAQGGMMPLLSDQISRNRELYRQILLSPLLDNHDVSRFSYWAQTDSKEKIKQAVTFLFTRPGLPMLYYGTEVALPGAAATNEQTGEGQDYLNRLMMPWDRVQGADADLVGHIRRVIQARRKWPAMRNDQVLECYKDYSVYAYLKMDRINLLVVLNNAATTEKRAIPLPAGMFEMRHRFVDLLTGNQYRSRRDTLRLELSPRSSLLLKAGRGREVERADWRVPFTPALSGDMKRVVIRAAPDAGIHSVHVAGDFNSWNPTAGEMRRQVDGWWQIDLPLKRGRYRYKFVVNGSQWLADPTAPEKELDPWGGENSVLVVK